MNKWRILFRPYMSVVIEAETATDAEDKFYESELAMSPDFEDIDVDEVMHES